MNNAELRSEVKRLREQTVGIKLLGKEIADNMDTIRFTLVANDFKNEDVDEAVKKVCGLLDFIDTAK